MDYTSVFEAAHRAKHPVHEHTAKCANFQITYIPSIDFDFIEIDTNGLERKSLQMTLS